jgi:hypothetical protein
MRKLRHRQTGLSFIGFVFIVSFLGILFVAGLRLIPLYMESFTVSSAMENVSKQPTIAQMTTADIRRGMMRHFEINDVNRFTDANLKEYLTVERGEDGKKRILKMAYEARGPLVYNLDVVLKFDKSIEIPGASVGE